MATGFLSFLADVTCNYCVCHSYEAKLKTGVNRVLSYLCIFCENFDNWLICLPLFEFDVVTNSCTE